jgi:hypothetical protein
VRCPSFFIGASMRPRAQCRGLGRLQVYLLQVGREKRGGGSGDKVGRGDVFRLDTVPLKRHKPPARRQDRRIEHACAGCLQPTRLLRSTSAVHKGYWAHSGLSHGDRTSATGFLARENSAAVALTDHHHSTACVAAAATAGTEATATTQSTKYKTRNDQWQQTR